MAIWKEQPVPARKDDVPPAAELAPKRVIEPHIEPAPTYPTTHSAPARDSKEALITQELSIEGKIEGSGHVRLAGRFKGEVNVQGNLSIEPGAKLTGGVRASTVTIGGEVEGNITDASKVELLATGVLTGDLKAGSLTVAAGSRMRGQVEFGWDEQERKRPGMRMEGGSAA